MHTRTTLQSLSFLLLGLGLTSIGCSAESSGDGDDDGTTGDGDSSSVGDGDGGGDGDDGGDGDIVVDRQDQDRDSCGSQSRETTLVPPELLILLDRSGSMVENNIEGGSNSRWVEATGALSAALQSTQAGINWGLKLYPDDDWCGVSAGANVPVAPMNAQSVIDAFTARPPVAGRTHTPTRSAVEQGQAYIQGLTSQNPKGIVLVTDGEPNCMAPWDADGIENDNDGTRDVEAPIAAVANAYAAGIPVYVVGFSISKDNTTEALNNIANAGGRATGNPFTAYYTAEDAAQFQAAMEEISADASSCTFELEEEVPESVGSVVLYLENQETGAETEVARDDSMTDGWTYTDAQTIEIYGASCDQVMAAANETLKIGYDCLPR